MKITIQLDDSVAEVYSSRLRETQTLEQILAIQLSRFVHCDPRDRFIVVDPASRGELEALTGQLPISTPGELIARVSTLAELSIGRIRFRWTPTQWRELKSRAERWRMTPQAFAERVVLDIMQLFFDRVPKELPKYEDSPAPSPSPAEKEA